MVTSHLPWKFNANRSSRFLVMLLTKKQRNKQRNRPKTILRPPTGGGVIKMMILQWSAVIQNALSGLIIHKLFATFLQRMCAKRMKVGWHMSKLWAKTKWALFIETPCIWAIRYLNRVLMRPFTTVLLTPHSVGYQWDGCCFVKDTVGQMRGRRSQHEDTVAGDKRRR